ncbi:unnamed protein product, partial [Didymodactylos carnosus]
MNEVEPSYMIPTRNYFRDVVIKKQCEEVGVQLRKELNDAKWVAVTSDMWSSDAKVNYITITAHYTDEQFVAHNRVL